MLHCLLTGFDPLRGLLWTSVGGHFYGVRVNRVDDSGFKTDRREWTHTPFLYRFPHVVIPKIQLNFWVAQKIKKKSQPQKLSWKSYVSLDSQILAKNQSLRFWKYCVYLKHCKRCQIPSPFRRNGWRMLILIRTMMDRKCQSRSNTYFLPFVAFKLVGHMATQ